MRLSAPGQPHLTYCTNIHAGERWSDVRENLERYVVEVKRRVSPGDSVDVGLRLSAQAAAALERPAADLRPLHPFAEGVYLHQVVEKREGGELIRYTDLHEAIEAAGRCDGVARHDRMGARA